MWESSSEPNWLGPNGCSLPAIHVNRHLTELSESHPQRSLSFPLPNKSAGLLCHLSMMLSTHRLANDASIDRMNQYWRATIAETLISSWGERPSQQGVTTGSGSAARTSLNGSDDDIAHRNRHYNGMASIGGHESRLGADIRSGRSFKFRNWFAFGRVESSRVECSLLNASGEQCNMEYERDIHVGNPHEWCGYCDVDNKEYEDVDVWWWRQWMILTLIYSIGKATWSTAVRRFHFFVLLYVRLMTHAFDVTHYDD